MREQCIDESACGVAGRRMHNESGGFVDDHEIRVLIEHIQRDELGLDLRGLRRWNFPFKRFAPLEFLPALGWLSIESDVALFDELLPPGSGMFGKDPAEPGVEP